MKTRDIFHNLMPLALFSVLATAAPADAAKERTQAQDAAGSVIETITQFSDAFVQNHNQWADRSIHFALRCRAANVKVTDAGLLFDLFRQGAPPTASNRDRLSLGPEAGSALPPGATPATTRKLSLGFPGARRVIPVGESESGQVFQYRLAEPASWLENVPSWKTVVYRGLYPGIDLRVAGQAAGLKYEFVLAPGADWRQIRVCYDGIERLELCADGSLVIHLGGDWPPLVDEAPVIYQVGLGEQVRVAGRFILCDRDTIGFKVDGPYDSKQPLIIDPQLSWCTSLAGEADGVAVDTGGNVFVVGKPPYALPFVAKLNPSGTQLWSKSFGNLNSSIAPHGIALDGQGNIYVTGDTSSSSWVSGSDTNYHGGALDGFEAAFDPSGNPLWSACFGGENWDRGFGIAVSSGGVVAVAGDTLSTNWLDGVTPAGFLLYLGAARIHNSSGFIWNDSQYCSSVAIDSQGYALVAGQTKHCQYFPPPQGGYTICNDYAFVSKWGGIGHEWTTLLTGSVAHSVAVDAARNAYVSGRGYLSTYPAVLSKLNPSGTTLWSVNVGGGSNYTQTAVAVDSASNVVVVGTSPTCSFVEKLTTGGTSLWRMSTPCGNGKTVAVDPAGNILVAGENFCAKIQPSSALRVVIQPPEAVAAGAKWRRVGTVDWLASGVTDTNFPPGTSTIEFCNVANWVTPCATSITLLDGQTGNVTNNYSWKLSDLAWSRNLGCMSNWFVPSCALDSQGNLLIAGTTSSSGWASGGYDTNLNGQDAFVIKLSPTGTPLWSTYLGGSSAEEEGYGIAVDSQDNVWVTGHTYSDSGWISGGYDATYNGYHDGFVVKLSPNGAHLWSTYLGGTQRDYGRGIVVDGAGNAYVTGWTESSNWVSGGFDTTFNGAFDGFVIKLSPSGAHLWSTYVGGNSGDYANYIAVDAAGNPCVTGWTTSSNWVAGGFDTSFNGSYDGFVVKLNTSGAHLWSTYLGGTNYYETGTGITTDRSNNVLVTGYGLAVTKLSSTGMLIWSTNAVGSTKAVFADEASNVLACGDSATNDLSGGFDVFHACAAAPAFVEKMDPSGTPVWSSFLSHGAQSIVVDHGAAIYVVGTKASAYSGADLWVSKIQDIVRLSQFTVTSGNARFVVEAYGLPGWGITVERTDSLANPISWQVESTAVITNTAPGRFEVQVPKQGAMRFYRVRPSL